VAETLLITLGVRAVESQRPDALIIDQKAAAIVCTFVQPGRAARNEFIAEMPMASDRLLFFRVLRIIATPPYSSWRGAKPDPVTQG
jgi:hypothetical protein